MQALAQDQLRTLFTMTEGFDDNLKIGIYDGDTSQQDRMCLRDNARMVFQQGLLSLLFLYLALIFFH